MRNRKPLGRQRKKCAPNTLTLTGQVRAKFRVKGVECGTLEKKIIFRFIFSYNYIAIHKPRMLKLIEVNFRKHSGVVKK